MNTASRCCKDCGSRYIGCHGKNPDGTWRCPAWGEEQERRQAEWEKTLSARVKDCVGGGYARENIRRYEARKRRGH